jgi:multiple sugar transport system permease protein
MTAKGTRERAPGALRRAVRRNLTAYGFLCAALICFAFFSWYPMVREVLLSFQKTNFVGPPEWVGLDNFRTVMEDSAFLAAWINTAAFTGLALIVGYAVPFVIAIVLNELRHAKAYLRFIVYLPVMLPPAVAVLLFKWFYNPGPMRTVMRQQAFPGEDPAQQGPPEVHAEGLIRLALPSCTMTGQWVAGDEAQPV